MNRYPERAAWRNMIARCHHRRHRQWLHYGGRGILVCAEWRASFDAFLAEIGPRPSLKHSLDRIDNERGYEPGNVRWATRTVQARNTRRSHAQLSDPNRLAVIRQLFDFGIPRQALADAFGVSYFAIDWAVGRHAPQVEGRR